MKNTKKMGIVVALIVLSTIFMGCANMPLGMSNLRKVPKFMVGTYYNVTALDPAQNNGRSISFDARYLDERVFTLTKNRLTKRIGGEWVTVPVNIRTDDASRHDGVKGGIFGSGNFVGTLTYTVNDKEFNTTFRFRGQMSMGLVSGFHSNVITFNNAAADDPFFGHLAAESVTNQFYIANLPHRIVGAWYPSQQLANEKGGVVANGGWSFHVARRDGSHFITGGGMSRLGAGTSHFMASEHQISRLTDTSFRVGGIEILYSIDGLRMTVTETNRSAVIEPGVYFKRDPSVPFEQGETIEIMDLFRRRN